MSDSLQPHGLRHSRISCPSPTPRACSNSGSSSWWCHLTISYSVVPFYSCLQSFLTSGSFPMSQLFTSGSQSTGVAALASVLPMNTQDWSPLGLTAWISLQSVGLSRVFSNTTVQKHQFFNTLLNCFFAVFHLEIFYVYLKVFIHANYLFYPLWPCAICGPDSSLFFWWFFLSVFFL